MKGFLFACFLVVVGYVAWQITPSDARSAGLGFIAKHGVRLGVLLFLVLLLLGAAVLFPSVQIL